MKEFEFTIEHDLRYEDSLDAIYELLDQFEERDDFDELDWDEDEEIAYLENDDIEIEIALDDGLLEIYVCINASDLSRSDIQHELEKDISEFFETDRPSRRRRSAPPKREERSSSRPKRREREETPAREERNEGRRSRRKSSASGGSRWAPEEQSDKPKRSEKASEESNDKPVKKPDATPAPKSGGMGWLWIVIVLAAIGAGAFFFLNK